MSPHNGGRRCDSTSTAEPCAKRAKLSSRMNRSWTVCIVRAISETLNRSLVKLRSMGQTCVIPQIEAPCIPRPRCRANGPRLELSCDGWPIREGTLRPCSAASTLSPEQQRLQQRHYRGRGPRLCRNAEQVNTAKCKNGYGSIKHELIGTGGSTSEMRTTNQLLRE